MGPAPGFEPGLASSPADRFGAVARELAPRCLDPLGGAGPSAGSSPARTVLELDLPPNAPRFRAALEQITGKCVAGAESHAGRMRMRLSASLESLRDRAGLEGRPGEESRALLAAHDAVHAPPKPPRIMGVLNVTPDSFSEGLRERWDDPGRVRDQGLGLVAEGAEILDVGGESTRPGSSPVELEEELRRVLPAIEALARSCDVPLSIDTTKSAVAERALDAGARIVNDVSAGRFDAAMIPLVARRGCSYVLMHMQGTPRDMQEAPHYDDVVSEVTEFLRERAAACWEAGVDPGRLIVDPGIGFGKRLEHNLELLARASELRSLGLPVLAGVSRKSFIARIDERAGMAPSGGSGAASRIGGTAAAVALCVRSGVEILRVHDVALMAQAARVAWAIRSAS